jgi:hypothetical protein
VWYSIHADEKRRKQASEVDAKNNTLEKTTEGIGIETTMNGLPSVTTSIDYPSTSATPFPPNDSTAPSTNAIESLPTLHLDPSAGIDPTQEEEKLPLSYYRNLVREKKGLEPLPQEEEMSDPVCLSLSFSSFCLFFRIFTYISDVVG